MNGGTCNGTVYTNLDFGRSARFSIGLLKVLGASLQCGFYEIVHAGVVVLKGLWDGNSDAAFALKLEGDGSHAGLVLSEELPYGMHGAVCVVGEAFDQDPDGPPGDDLVDKVLVGFILSAAGLK